jgi:hypothetical protein
MWTARVGWAPMRTNLFFQWIPALFPSYSDFCRQHSIQDWNTTVCLLGQSLRLKYWQLPAWLDSNYLAKSRITSPNRNRLSLRF